MNYAITHNGIAYGPSGRITDTAGTPLKTEDVSSYNKQLEEKQLAWLRSGPERCFLYVRMPKHVAPFSACGPGNATELDRPAITTWLGLSVATHVYIGPRRKIGFDRWTYRRPVSCRIFGTLYHGWYMESSGNYCRLKKAKRQ